MITYIFSWEQVIGWEDCVEVVTNWGYNSFVFIFGNDMPDRTAFKWIISKGRVKYFRD
jgi:hypothetical protein